MHTIKARGIMSHKYRPGDQVPATGNYTAFDKEGQDGGTTYLERGKRFPATQHEGSYYVLTDEI